MTLRLVSVYENLTVIATSMLFSIAALAKLVQNSQSITGQDIKPAPWSMLHTVYALAHMFSFLGKLAAMLAIRPDRAVGACLLLYIAAEAAVLVYRTKDRISTDKNISVNFLLEVADILERAIVVLTPQCLYHSVQARLLSCFLLLLLGTYCCVTQDAPSSVREGWWYTQRASIQYQNSKSTERTQMCKPFLVGKEVALWTLIFQAVNQGALICVFFPTQKLYTFSGVCFIFCLAVENDGRTSGSVQLETARQDRITAWISRQCRQMSVR